MIRGKGSHVYKSLRERQEENRLRRRVARLPDAPERRSVARAMLAVENRLVKAFWAIARQPARMLPDTMQKCGLDYYHETSDIHSIYADAAGGKWDAIAPRPPIPSSREIDAANQALDWLLFLDEGQRRLLVAAATTKCGDAGRQVNWMRLREGRKEFKHTSSRTLRWRYRDANQGGW